MFLNKLSNDASVRVVISNGFYNLVSLLCASCLLFELLQARLSWWLVSLSRWSTSYNCSNFKDARSWPYIEKFTVHGYLQAVLIYYANEENIHSVEKVSCKHRYVSQKIYDMKSFVIIYSKFDASITKSCRSRMVCGCF